MIAAFLKAIDQIGDSSIRSAAWISLGSTLAVFAGLWLTVTFVLYNTALFSWGWLETITDFLGWLAALVISWALFPGVVSAFTGLMSDRVADAVEARHYPGLPPTGGAPFGEALRSAAKFLIVMVFLNIFLLAFLFIPPLFPFVFYGVNGYLLCREYFSMVALRRIGSAEAEMLRKAHRGQLFFFGVLIALMLTVPVVNLLAPIIAAAAMVHLFEGWRSHKATVRPAVWGGRKNVQEK